MLLACVPLTDRLILLVALLTTPRIVESAIHAYRSDGPVSAGDGRGADGDDG